MSGSTDQEDCAGSKATAAVRPRWAPPLWPPTTMMRPSAICSWPEQKSLTGMVARANLFAAGSQVRPSKPSPCPSHMRIRPPGICAMWTGTIGKVVRPEKSPVTAGFPGLAFEKVTWIGAAYPTLRAESMALADSMWTPLLNFVVSTETEYGALLSTGEAGTPSTTPCVPSIPDSASEAVNVTVTVPLSVAPAAGEVRVTSGGLTSGGGGVEATLNATSCMIQNDPDAPSGAVAL